MAVLGLILLAAAGVLTAAVVTSNTGATNVDLWGATLSNVSLGAIFVAGMLTTLVGVAGIILMTAGVRRTRRLQQERRVLRRENQRLTKRVQTTDPVRTSDRVRTTNVAPSDATERPDQPTDGTRRDTIFSRLRPAGARGADRPADRAGDRVEASGPGSA